MLCFNPKIPTIPAKEVTFTIFPSGGEIGIGASVYKNNLSVVKSTCQNNCESQAASRVLPARCIAYFTRSFDQSPSSGDGIMNCIAVRVSRIAGFETRSSGLCDLMVPFSIISQGWPAEISCLGVNENITGNFVAVQNDRKV